MSNLDNGGYCQNCRACVPQCPHKVEIPNLMRAFRYSEEYGNLSEAEWTLGTLPEYQGLAACRSCSDCRVRCMHGMNIDRNVRTLKRHFAIYA